MSINDSLDSENFMGIVYGNAISISKSTSKAHGHFPKVVNLLSKGIRLGLAVNRPNSRFKW